MVGIDYHVARLQRRRLRRRVFGFVRVGAAAGQVVRWSALRAKAILGKLLNQDVLRAARR